MATRSEDAQAMIAACEKAHVKLMVAYRIQYQTHNRRAARMVREGAFGRLVGLSSVNVQTVHQTGAQQWRHKRALAGGGALPDIGLYCINTSRFLCGEEPTQVYAAQLYSPPNDARYAEVEETVSFTLRLPSNFVATCLASYGARNDKYQRLSLAKATVDMPDAYQYEGQRILVAEQHGPDDARSELTLPRNNQFAAELDHFAGCVLTGRKPFTPGEEGLQDHRIMEGLYESAKTGKPVELPRPSYGRCMTTLSPAQAPRPRAASS